MVDDGFPHRSFPTGWFQVAWSDELEAGAVRPLRYFGQALVLYRTAEGRAVVLDGHCPHLGAHLGHGGVVEGDCIVCPFHAWKWGSDGANVEIPHSARGRQRRSTRAWTVVERGGLVFTWHDEAGRDPLWDAPAIPHADDPTYLRPYPATTHHWPGAPFKPQYPIENVVDQFHFTPVHRSANPAHLDDYEADGPVFRTHLRMTMGEGKGSTRLTPEGPKPATIATVSHGVGVLVFQFEGFSSVVYVQGFTPIDETTSDMRLTVLLPEAVALDGDGLSRYAEATMREILVQTDRDIEIWANWQYVANPPLTVEESKPYRAVRTWCEQFYPDTDRRGRRRTTVTADG